MLDGLHGAGVHREVVGKDRGDDDDDDGPDGHGKALERGGGHVDGAHLPAEQRAGNGHHQGADAGLVGLHVQAAQGNDEPDDGQKGKDEHSQQFEHGDSQGRWGVQKW